MEFPRFRLVWYDEITSASDLQRALGEMIGTTHMLAFIRDSLDDLANLDDLDHAIQQAELLVESYHQRLYFLRERAQGVVRALTGVKGLVQKDPTKRERAFAYVARTAPLTGERVRALLDLVCSDVEARNLHTHRIYHHLEFHVGLNLGSDGYDARDVLVEIEGTDQADKIHASMREALQRLGDEYREKIWAVITATIDLAKAVEADARNLPSGGNT